MSRATAKSAIAEALRLLSRDHLQKFCFFLHDRREDPRVTRTDLGDGSVETISDMLVSKFSAAGAVGVTMDLLRSLTYNSAADVLGECVVFHQRQAFRDRGAPQHFENVFFPPLKPCCNKRPFAATHSHHCLPDVAAARERGREQRHHWEIEGGREEGERKFRR